MNDCSCNQRCDHGAGVVPGACISRNCGKDKIDLRIKTEVIPASAGTDAEGQPYAPKLGNYHNTLVQYVANGNIIFYDTKGVWTRIDDPAALAKAEKLFETKLQNETEARVQADTALNNAIIKTAELLQTNINAEVNAREKDRDNLQKNINAEVNARIAADKELEQKIEDLDSEALDQEIVERKAADEALQASIDQEAATREQADNEFHEEIAVVKESITTGDNNLQTQIDALVASTDVKDVVGTKAELDAYDTSTLGNNDIIKVLNDESEDGAITYYRWSTADDKFTLIGETGPYYTKSEADDTFATIEAINELDEKVDTKQDILKDSGAGQNLKTINWNSLLGAGNINIPLPPYSVGAASKNNILTIKTAPKAVGLQFNTLVSTLGTYSLTDDFLIPAANSAEAGVMSNTDKVKLDGLADINTIGDNLTLTDGTLSALKTDPIAIGPRSSSKSTSIAIGSDASTKSYTNSVALGQNATNSRNAEVSIASGDSSSAPSTRYLANVRAGTLDTDAVNKKQMEEYVAENVSDTYGLTQAGATAANNLAVNGHQLVTSVFSPQYTPNTVTQRVGYSYIEDGDAETVTRTFNAATSTTAGVMVAADKAKLDSLADIQSVGSGLSLSSDGVLSASGSGGGGGGATLLYHTTDASKLGENATAQMYTIPSDGIYTISCSLTYTGTTSPLTYKAMLVYGSLNNQVMGISSEPIRRYVKNQIVVEGTRSLTAGTVINLSIYNTTTNDTSALPSAASDLDFSVVKLA